MSFTIQSVRLPTGDAPVCNVTLEPYVLIKRGDTTVTADDVPEEGSGEGLFQLKSRWFRSALPRGGTVCCVHPEQEAILQCTVCLRCKVANHLSYHCSPECFKAHWARHLEYHRQAAANGALKGGMCMVGEGAGEAYVGGGSWQDASTAAHGITKLE
jgi:CCR4-NOT transcription complex subunit 6